MPIVFGLLRTIGVILFGIVFGVFVNEIISNEYVSCDFYDCGDLCNGYCLTPYSTASPSPTTIDFNVTGNGLPPNNGSECMFGIGLCGNNVINKICQKMIICICICVLEILFIRVLTW